MSLGCEPRRFVTMRPARVCADYSSGHNEIPASMVGVLSSDMCDASLYILCDTEFPAPAPSPNTHGRPGARTTRYLSVSNGEHSTERRSRFRVSSGIEGDFARPVDSSRPSRTWNVQFSGHDPVNGGFHSGCAARFGGDIVVVIRGARPRDGEHARGFSTTHCADTTAVSTGASREEPPSRLAAPRTARGLSEVSQDGDGLPGAERGAVERCRPRHSKIIRPTVLSATTFSSANPDSRKNFADRPASSSCSSSRTQPRS